jgi:hypothetical protein
MQGYLWSPDQLSLVLFNFYWNINEGQFDLFFQYHIPVAVTLASTVAVSQTLSTVQVNICQSMSTVQVNICQSMSTVQVNIGQSLSTVQVNISQCLLYR